MYSLPILRVGEISLFIKLWSTFALSGWLFATYPIGGWSHTMFHIVLAFVPPILMEIAVGLSASQTQIHAAAKCAALRTS